jgi:hypothetical protein
LKSPEQSVVCAIKLLLAHALWHGHTYGETIREVLDHTARRFDRVVQWKIPNAPVLCAIAPRAAFLRLDTPAHQGQITQTVKQMARISGIMAHVTSKDIRNGSARGTAYLMKDVRGAASGATALVLGHSEGSLASGVTRDYIGPHQETVYNLRAENPLKIVRRRNLPLYR